MTKRDCAKYGCQVYIAHQATNFELSVCITCGVWYIKKPALGTYVHHGEFEAAWSDYKYLLSYGRTTFL